MKGLGGHMDNLFILLSEDRKTKRYIQIMKYLKHQKTVATETIASELDLIRGTVVNDLSELQNILPEGIELIQDFRKGYRIEYDSNNSIDYYIAKLCRTTPVYKIIDSLLQQDGLSISDLAEKVFLSESVVYKRISYMNRILKSYHISISTRTLEFVGSEADIRCFLFAFYRTFMDYFSTKPIDSIYEKSYDKTMIALQESGVCKLHVNNAKVFLWTVITRIRIMNKRFITFENTFEKQTKEKSFYQEFKYEYLQTLVELQEEFDKLDFVLPESEIIWAYLVNLDCVEYTPTNNIDPDKSELYREDDTTTAQEVTQIIENMLKKKFDLCLSDKSVYTTIVAYFINIVLLSNVSTNFQKISVPLKQHIREGYSETYHTWLEELEINSDKLPLLINKDDIACTLTMLTVPIIHSHKKGSLNILFSFEAEAGYSSILVDASTLLVTPGVTATYIFSSSVTPEFIEENNIDMLVSNFEQRNEENFNCRLIRLSYIPTASEWTQLRNEIIEAL